MDIRFEWVDKKKRIFKAIIKRGHKKSPVQLYLKYYQECCHENCPLNRTVSNLNQPEEWKCCTLIKIKEGMISGYTHDTDFVGICQDLSNEFNSELDDLFSENPFIMSDDDEIDYDCIGPAFHNNQWGYIKDWMLDGE